jgi:hypothetical protein
MNKGGGHCLPAMCATLRLLQAATTRQFAAAGKRAAAGELDDVTFVPYADAPHVRAGAMLPVRVLRRQLASAARVVGIRREDKNRWERRVPLTPSHVRRLVDDGVRVLVQSSPRRVVPDIEFAEVRGRRRRRRGGQGRESAHARSHRPVR